MSFQGFDVLHAMKGGNSFLVVATIALFSTDISEKGKW